MYLDILNNEAKNLSKSNREFLTRTMASANQLSGLMHNLLNVSRIERGELGYQPEPINYASFISEATRELKLRAKEQHRTLRLKLPLSLPAITADPTSIQEILSNLITNAIDHTPPKTGEITVTVSKHHDNIETRVQDNGTGIPADAIPHLFTKFYRVDEISSSIRGTGLGLYICRAIVEAHGGTIWVESTLGEGSTFIFRLPIKPVAHTTRSDDNNLNKQNVTREAHGWIKDNPIH
jgi:signal transduction histidine kinase